MLKPRSFVKKALCQPHNQAVSGNSLWLIRNKNAGLTNTTLTFFRKIDIKKLFDSEFRSTSWTCVPCFVHGLLWNGQSKLSPHLNLQQQKIYYCFYVKIFDVSSVLILRIPYSARCHICQCEIVFCWSTVVGPF